MPPLQNIVNFCKKQYFLKEYHACFIILSVRTKEKIQMKKNTSLPCNSISLRLQQF